MRHDPTSRSWLNVLRPNIITSLIIEIYHYRLSAPPTLLEVYNLPRSKFRILHSHPRNLWSFLQAQENGTADFCSASFTIPEQKTFWSKSTPSWKEIAPPPKKKTSSAHALSQYSGLYTWECICILISHICSTATGNLEHVQNFL